MEWLREYDTHESDREREKEEKGNWLDISILPSLIRGIYLLLPLPFTPSLAQKSIRFDESSHLLHFAPIGKQIRLAMALKYLVTLE